MSIGFSTEDLVRWTGGERVRGSGGETYEGVSIDTRTIEAGQLFVAIAGPQYDAHDFLEDAVRAGAAGLMIDRGAQPATQLPENLPIVATEDTTAALGALAAGHRGEFTGPVVAITGSNGKTTTKEMCAAILETGGPCLKTLGNLNNEYGLPLTLLRRGPADLSVVVELGMNHRGEIERLAAIAQPTVGLVTNIGTAHIEHLGSREEIAKEKGDILAALGEKSTAVVNVDEPLIVEQAKRALGDRITFGRDPSADVRAESIEFVDGGAFEFRLITPRGEAGIRVVGLSETTIINALAAAATAMAAGVPVESIRLGFLNYRPIGGRMAPRRLKSGATLIDDTYNANPQSMRSALESLAQLKGEGRSIAVLGDMGELGGSAAAAHREMGALAAELGTDFLIVLGDQAQAIAQAATDARIEDSRVHVAMNHDEIGQLLLEIAQPGDWILIKGSRSMRMEKVIDKITAEENS